MKAEKSGLKNAKAVGGQIEKKVHVKEPDIIGTVDLLDRVSHKLKCFSALFYTETVMECWAAGAAFILDDIVDEIETAKGKLIPNLTKERGGG